MIRYVFVLYHQIIHKHKREGIIVDVIERANETIVGTYDRQQHFGFVVPDDERIGTDIFVDLKIL